MCRGHVQDPVIDVEIGKTGKISRYKEQDKHTSLLHRTFLEHTVHNYMYNLLED